MFVYCSESYVIFSKNIILALLYNLQSGTNLSVLECSPCEAAGFTRIHLVKVQVNQRRFGPIGVLWGTNGGGSGERCFIQSPAFPFPNSFHGRLLGWFCVTNHPVRQVAWTHHKNKRCWQWSRDNYPMDRRLTIINCSTYTNYNQGQIECSWMFTMRSISSVQVNQQ